MAQTENNSGVAPENINVLSADNPLIDPNDDRLGYAPFAKNLANSICQMSPPDGFVMAVYGAWGSGKSTLLNFIVHYLEQKPESEQPIIVPFNPWWFSGHEDLTKRFFDQLQAVLSNKLKSVAKGLTKRIASFADTVSEAPVPYAKGGKVIARFLERQKDVYKLKEEVEKILKKQQRRIVVVIDDIDRLTAEEIRQLFRVVKAVANFPNVIYLLLFDKEVVVKALKETQGISGEAYLEKIVQVPFELPLPDKMSLRRLLIKLDAILADTPEQLFDQTHWANVFFAGIDHFIRTPRDIVRLINTLSVTYPAVKGEVNPVDFIAIESLRVFCPVIYDIIRKHPEEFAGYVTDRSFPSSRVEVIKPLHDSWIAQIQDGDREPVKNLLKRLFPKLEAVWGNTYYGAESASSWRRELRVCSLEIFPVYFCLAVPEGNLSNTEMQAILALAGNAKAFGKKLLELAEQERPDGTTRVRAFLEQLEDFTQTDIPLNCIPTVVKALFDVGDQLLRPEDERQGMFDFGNDMRIGRISWQLLRRFDELERFEILKEVSNGKAFSMIVREVAILGQQQGKFGSTRPKPEEEWIVTTEHLNELEDIVLKRVRDAAQSNSLLPIPNLPQILYSWREWANEDEVKVWVQKAIDKDKGLINFLEKFLSKTFSHSGSDLVQRIGYRLDSKSLEPFLEPFQIIDRVRRLAEDSRLTEKQKIAAKQFIKEYEMRQQGKDPNFPLD
ncbi:MAG TPA: P-loop NTPase fold protein [Allocoleopsis sp.]